MIMNKVGGGGSGGGVTTRTVGMSEIYFGSYVDSKLTGYRTVYTSRGGNNPRFYFPGKVLQVLSFKYRFRQSNSSGGFGDETTYTGEWKLFGNVATPDLNIPVSSNYDYHYAVTELTAIIEDEASGGQVQSVTLTVSSSEATRYKFSSNIISVSNLTSPSAIPSGADSKAALIGKIEISGSLLFVTGGSSASVSVTLNVKLATMPGQGILKRVDSDSNSSGSIYGLGLYTGFRPKYMVFSKSSADSNPGNGLISGNWFDSGGPISFSHSRIMVANGSSTDGYELRAGGLSMEYNEDTGYASLHFSASYGVYTSGTFEIIAVG